MKKTVNSRSYYYFRQEQIEIVPYQNQCSVTFPSSKAFTFASKTLSKYFQDIKWHFFELENLATVDLSAADLKSLLKDIALPPYFIQPVYYLKDKKYEGARDLVMNNRFIIHFNKTLKADAIKKICLDYKCVPVETLVKGDNMVLVRYTGDEEGFLPTINRFNEVFTKETVRYAHPDFINGVQMTAEPPFTDNPEFHFQQAALQQIGVLDAWAAIKTGDQSLPPTRVAILDEGIQITHPDLGAQKVINRSDRIGGTCPYNSNNGHGTAVAGIIGAANNNLYIVGVAPHSLLADIRISYTSTSGFRQSSTSKVNRGLQDAIDWKARVINISWSHPPVDSITSQIEAAIDKKIVVCCAAGNYSGSESQAVLFPAFLAATHPVIAVAACDALNNLIDDSATTSFGSRRGPEVTVAAPGIHIATLRIGGANFITDFKGTSASTAFVSGIAAIILSLDPTLLPVAVRDLLKNTATPTGTGPVVNALAAVGTLVV